MLYRFLICCALLISSYATPLYASDDFDIDIEYTLEDPIPTDEYETIEEESSSTEEPIQTEEETPLLEETALPEEPTSSKETTKKTENKKSDNLINTLIDKAKSTSSSLVASVEQKTQETDKYSHLDLLTKIKSDIPTNIYDVEKWVATNQDINKCYENGRTILLYLVAETNNTEGIKYLIDSGADLYTHCMPQQEALFVAVENNVNPSVIETLIVNNTNLMHTDSYGNNALMLAAVKNPNPEILKILIEYGLDINEKNDNGFDALTLASFNNSKLSIIETLIDYQANVNSTDPQGHTPLMAASLNGNDEIMRYLIQRGANASATDKNGLTVLDFYNKRQYLETLNYKENPFDDISEHLKNRFTFITQNHFSLNELLKQSTSKENSLEHITLALDNLVDVDILADNGCTTLLNAGIDNNPFDVIKTLVEQNANVNATCKNGKNTLMFISMQSNDPTLAILQNQKAEYLLKNNIDPNAQDDNGDTALTIALKNNADISYIKTLLQNGVDANLSNQQQETPLNLAIKNQHPIAVIELLLNSGANGNIADSKGNTPLWHYLRYAPTVENLSGASKGNTAIDYADENGDTPLIFALKNDYSAEIIRFLLENGADPKLKNYEGKDAYDIIKAKKYFKEAIKKTTSDVVKENWY
ncbi:MAG: ankyrin repeat domain-containing protein [Alphaproteobacteria bacterium]|nr:ankyrin repeat domain-containing protein [Alphaproteobacteria bacterium]